MIDPDEPVRPGAPPALRRARAAADRRGRSAFFGPRRHGRARAAVADAGSCVAAPRGLARRRHGRRRTAQVDVRAGAGHVYSIVIADTGELLGHRRRAPRLRHARTRRRLPAHGRAVPGQELDLVRPGRRRPAPTPTTTRRRARSPTSRSSAALERRCSATSSVSFGDVRVTDQVVGFVRKLVSTSEVVDEEPLPLPPQRARDPRVVVDAPGAA